MKGKNPTREQRKILFKNGLDSCNWLVQKDTPDKMQLIHRDTKEVKVVFKGKE